jgi:hypothetical protein
MTIAVNNGYSMARSEKARAQWEAGRRARAEDRPASKVEGFHKLLGFLNSNFPGSVKVN